MADDYIKVGEDIEWFNHGRARITEIEDTKVSGIFTARNGRVTRFWTGKLEWAMTRRGIDDGQCVFIVEDPLLPQQTPQRDQ